MIDKDYLNKIKERKAKSHVYKKFQLIGLTIADILNDQKHKAIYIKLAQQYDEEILLNLAKDTAQRENIENKGGYFMKVLQNKKLEQKIQSPTKTKPKKPNSPINKTKVISKQKPLKFKKPKNTSTSSGYKSSVNKKDL